MKKLLLFLACLFATPAFANQAARGWCESGAQVVVVSGLPSTTQVQASFPSCTITVSVHGGGLATIFADNSNTPLANPFTAQSGGQWTFYAANGHYDVLMSGAGFPSSVTYSDILFNDALGTVNYVSLAFSATPTFNASVGGIFAMTLTGNVTSSTITNPVQGQFLTFYICQDGVGSHTFAWPAGVLNPPTILSAASACSTSQFFYNGANWIQNNEVLGPTAITGTLTATAACNISGVLIIAPACYTGTDIMAQIQTAYNSTSCPTSSTSTTTGSGGCEIFVPPQTGGGCYPASTSLNLTTNLRFVFLRGDPGGATCINWTPTTGTAITADAGSPIQNSLYYNNGAVVIKDIMLSGSGPGNATIAIQWGSVNGCFGCRFIGGGIKHFGTGHKFGNNTFPWLMAEHSVITDVPTPINYPSGITGSGEQMKVTHSIIANCGTPSSNNINLTGAGPVDWFFDNDDIDNCQISNNNTSTGAAGIHVFLSGGHMENPGYSATPQDYIVQANSAANSLVVDGTYFVLDEPSIARSHVVTVNGGTATFMSPGIILNTGAIQDSGEFVLAQNGAQVTMINPQLKNAPIAGGTLIATASFTGSYCLLTMQPANTFAGMTCSAANSWPFNVNTDNSNIEHMTNGGADWLQVNASRQFALVNGASIAGPSTTNTPGNLLISSTAPTIAAAGCGGAAASITVNNGTASFNINVGTTPTTACTVTMPTATNGWNCYAVDVTTNSTSVFVQKQSPAASQTTTQIVITNFNDVAVATAFVASDIVRVACSAN